MLWSVQSLSNHFRVTWRFSLWKQGCHSTSIRRGQSFKTKARLGPRIFPWSNWEERNQLCHRFTASAMTWRCNAKLFMLSPNRQKLIVVGSTQGRRLAHDQEETETVRERHAARCRTYGAGVQLSEVWLQLNSPLCTPKVKDWKG